MKDGEAVKYTPAYEPVEGKVGEEATVKAPTFLDEKSTEATKPEANPQPTGMKFALGAGYTGTATVDAQTGAVTYTPQAGDEGKAINVPVVVTYSDGTTDEATAVINVADRTKTTVDGEPKTVKPTDDVQDTGLTVKDQDKA
ncbi:MAG: Rib/alpha-like domain-containing protein, partial [Finegoldia magna]